jgi:hypothetical protein
MATTTQYKKARLVFAIQGFFIMVASAGIITLAIQMRLLNLHLSHFSNSMDRYMAQQQLENAVDKVLFHYNETEPDNYLAEEEPDEDLRPILKILHQAGYNVYDPNEVQRDQLPRWSTILEAYGPPKILGLETCQRYRDTVEPQLRNMGVAGTFNSGTNLLGALLAFNCRSTVRNRKYDAFHWQVRFVKPMNKDGKDKDDTRLLTSTTLCSFHALLCPFVLGALGKALPTQLSRDT